MDEVLTIPNFRPTRISGFSYLIFHSECREAGVDQAHCTVIMSSPGLVEPGIAQRLGECTSAMEAHKAKSLIHVSFSPLRLHSGARTIKDPLLRSHGTG